jgi:hypothetical protein
LSGLLLKREGWLGCRFGNDLRLCLGYGLGRRLESRVLVDLSFRFFCNLRFGKYEGWLWLRFCLCLGFGR